jgi:hypothetical protein
VWRLRPAATGEPNCRLSVVGPGDPARIESPPWPVTAHRPVVGHATAARRNSRRGHCGTAHAVPAATETAEASWALSAKACGSSGVASTKGN